MIITEMSPTKQTSLKWRDGIIVVWKVKSVYCLLWTLREIISMLNINLPTEKSFFTEFGEELKFSIFYHLVKETKELNYKEDIPEPSCFCFNLENDSCVTVECSNCPNQDMAKLDKTE